MMSADRDIYGKLVSATEAYVGEVLHMTLTLQPWSEAETLPPYLRSRYLILQGDLGGRRALWLFARDEPTPGAVEKHIAAIEARWAEAQIVVFDRLPPYVRRRLIEKGISFVVPGRQLYLPRHGLEFRSRAGRVTQVRDVLRPSAQAMLLYLLLHPRNSEHARSASTLAPVLGQTKMTASRAVAELEAHGLADVRKAGRTKGVRLPGEAREVWEAAQRMLRTPVAKRFTLVGGPAAVTGRYLWAGLSALSRLSPLAEPRALTYAVDRVRARAWDMAGAANAQEWPSMADEVGSTTIEVWSYDPLPLSNGEVVDPLSLSLSLRDDPDERVQGALGRLLETLPW